MLKVYQSSKSGKAAQANNPEALIHSHFAPFNIIIDSFMSTTLITNFSIAFLQTIVVVKFYWFASGPIIYITFLLINNLSPH